MPSSRLLPTVHLTPAECANVAILRRFRNATGLADVNRKHLRRFQPGEHHRILQRVDALVGHDGQSNRRLQINQPQHFLGRQRLLDKIDSEFRQPLDDAQHTVGVQPPFASTPELDAGSNGGADRANPFDIALGISADLDLHRGEALRNGPARDVRRGGRLDARDRTIWLERTRALSSEEFVDGFARPPFPAMSHNAISIAALVK
jgi:hypothetical protein